MISIYSFEQTSEKLGLHEAELRFLAHHLWEFFSPTPSDVYTRSFSGADIALLERVVKMQREDNQDLTSIRQNLRKEASLHNLGGRRNAPVLAFGSGRAGVGTSSIVWNVAAALAERGARCTVVDGSFGDSGVSVAARIPDSTEWNLVLESGIRLINLAELFALEGEGDDPEEISEEITKELALLDAASDFILIDTGSGGGSDTVLRYATATDETILVTTGDVGVNMDTFSMIRMLRDVDPDLAIGLVVNRAISLSEAREAFSRINGAGRKLGLSEVPGLGWVIEDEALRKTMADGQSVVSGLPNSPSARCLALLADVLVNRLTPPHRQRKGGLLEMVNSLAANFRRLNAVRVFSPDHK